MERIAEAEIRKAEKLVYLKVPETLEVEKGYWVIAEFVQGTQECVRILDLLDTLSGVQVAVSGKVLRKATEQDMAILAENIAKKGETMKICQEKIREHKLPMKLIDADYSFDKTKITFYCWAEGRIDFRKLVRDLASVFNCRIEIRQIGLRDEARIKGGYGICGQRICCAQFLKSFESITMRMVKNQKLPMDMGKISGLCGRLLCCLAYEENSYRERNKETATDKEKQ